jgi:hypothetical protein
MEEARVKSFSSALQDIQESKIIVHPLQKKERIESFYIQTARELFSEEGCRMLWRRRLEETAWVLYKRGHEGEARLAMRVARLLATPTEDPSKSAFIVELIRRSIAQSLEQKKKADAMKPSLIVKP